MIKYNIACAAAFSAAYLASANASAVVTITSPFASAGIAIGAAGATGGAMVACFEEGGFGAGQGFRMEHLGFSEGLMDDFVIQGGSGNDVVIFVQSTRTDLCGLTLSPLRYNGNFLDIHSLGGSDFVFGAQGDTFYLGGSGNDFLFNHSPVGRSFGGTGNDQVLSFSSGNGDRIFGEGGADCLFDSTATFAAFDCGSGADKFSNSPKPPGTVSCETATSCCGICL
jgi:hypothetical protein